jgi:hypothetical protein
MDAMELDRLDAPAAPDFARRMSTGELCAAGVYLPGTAIREPTPRVQGLSSCEGGRA